MSNKKFSHVDACFVVPSSAKKAYQKLADVYSAIEPPTWALLLAQALRKKSYDCVILDFDADPKNIDQSIKEIADTKPKLVIFVLYGQNPNSGTVNMSGAIKVAEELKKQNNNTPLSFVGSHISALPYEVLEKETQFKKFRDEVFHDVKTLAVDDIFDPDIDQYFSKYKDQLFPF